MDKSPGQRGWQQAIERLLARFQDPGLGFRKAALIWVAAFTVVVLACAAFFLLLFWLFS